MLSDDEGCDCDTPQAEALMGAPVAHALWCASRRDLDDEWEIPRPMQEHSPEFIAAADQAEARFAAAVRKILGKPDDDR